MSFLKAKRRPFFLSLFLSLALLAGCATTGSVPDEAHDHGGSVKVETLAKSGASWNGAKLPPYPEEAPLITMLKITVPPHSELDWHNHPCINAGYLISGELIVTSETGQTLTLHAGDGLIEMVDTWHYGRNDRDEPAEIVVVYVGIEGQPLAVMRED